MPDSPYWNRQWAYNHVLGTLRGSLEYLPGTDIVALDESAAQVLAEMMTIVAAFKLEGLPDPERAKVIEMTWQIFKEHCESDEVPARMVDVLFETCMDKAAE